MQREQLRKEFRGFPKAYSLAPLWYWNDELHEDELARQLDEMRRRHVNEAMIFPMAGLQTPYLSEDYFAAFRFTLREAKKRGMRIWIYDEYCWPSGVAGGIINADYPEYLMRAGRFYRYPVEAGASREVMIELPPGRLLWAEAVRESDGKRVELPEACDEFALRWNAPAGAWDILVCVVHPVQFSLEACTVARWSHHAPGYIDVMNREAMAKYIELVYDGHYRAAPEYFGSVMPGFFTDEPGVRYDMRIRGGRAEIGADGHTGYPRPDAAADEHAGNPILYGFARSVPWTRDLLAMFRERYGYDLRPRLPELAKTTGADRTVCHDYFQLISDRFAESYAEQIGAWCARHKVMYTGHYGEDVNGGDYYRQIKPMQVPGIDLLGGRCAVENLIILPRRVATIARMQGRERVMAETYGATHWNMELSEKVNAADLLTILGINLHAPIDFAYSFRSFRKHTSNPPGFFQSPGWAYQEHFSTHTARMCRALAAGRSAVTVGLLYGSSEALANSIPDPNANATLEYNLKRNFLAFAHAQIETDIVHETGLEDGKYENGKLTYPGVAYDTLALPPLNILRRETVKRLVRFVRGGGTLLVVGRLPVTEPRGGRLAADWRPLTGIAAAAAGGEIVERKSGRGRWIFIPDFTRMISISAPVAGGEIAHLFDGTDSLLCLAPRYPITIAVDFGQPLTLTAFSMTIEHIKQHIVYDVELHVSADGRRWRKVAAGRRSGLVHEMKLKNVEARHFRLLVRSADDPKRFFGLTDFGIRYRAEQSAETRWTPLHTQTSPLPELLPRTLPALTFLENGALARDLIGAGRALGRDRIQALFNRGAVERQLTARAAEGYTVEEWDVDSGKCGRIALDGGAFPLTLAPHEAKLFVLRRDGKTPRLPAVSLDLRGKTLSESAGPWPFRPGRANAFPLAAGSLRMADPARPETWLPVDTGRIPEPLRLVPVLLFACDFEAADSSLPVELLIEQRIYTHLAVNGRAVPDSAFKVNRYCDAFGAAAAIGPLLKRGRNRITGWYLPEMFERMAQGSLYRWPAIQPTLDAALLGPFAVVGTRLEKPHPKLAARPWQEQGFPYFSGTGVYSVELKPARRPDAAIWLEAAARGGVIEVRAGNRRVGVRLAAPYRFDVTKHVKTGRNAFEILVTNTIGSLHSAVRIGSLASPAAAYTSGLEWVRLRG